MYYVYVLRSKKTGRLYKGQCRDLEKRLSEHNHGKTRSTKSGIPWELVYWEAVASRAEALERERYFKTAAGRRYLQKRL